MIAYTCRRCHSTKLQKNGRTKTGQQKFHCKACGFYGTLYTKDAERARRCQMAEQLHLERLSQRAIARTVKMSRNTIRGLLRKSLDTDWRNDPTTHPASNSGDR